LFKNIEKIVVIACGALAREIKIIQDLNNLNNLELICLPAKLHNTPDKIVPALREKISQIRSAEPDVRIYVGYADCGTGGGIDRLCEEYDIQRLPGAHCYQFYYGMEQFEADSATHMRTFFLTDFLLQQFDILVWQALGLDRYPELRDAYFRNYTTLLYLAQNPTPKKEKAAQEAAHLLGLKYSFLNTGYGMLEASLRQI
jgi:hypothetical protein